MKIGILGGTFDPIHYAHLYIAYEALQQLSLDKVIFMPAAIQPLKIDRETASANFRYEMIKRAITSYEKFEVCDYEINKGGISFTYETLEYLKNRKDESNVELFFITGADCLVNIEKWKEVNKLFSLCTMVVFMRGGLDKEKLLKQKKYVEDKYNSKIMFLDLKELEISSTDIRDRVRENKRIDFFVPQSVLDFIYEKKLYK